VAKEQLSLPQCQQSPDVARPRPPDSGAATSRAFQPKRMTDCSAPRRAPPPADVVARSGGWTRRPSPVSGGGETRGRPPERDRDGGFSGGGTGCPSSRPSPGLVAHAARSQDAAPLGRAAGWGLLVPPLREQARSLRRALGYPPTSALPPIKCSEKRWPALLRTLPEARRQSPVRAFLLLRLCPSRTPRRGRGRCPASRMVFRDDP
jgi:hypothetical protein